MSSTFIQYGKQTIEECDIQAVVDVLRTNTFLTTGPLVAEFEQKVCEMVGVKHGVAVNNGTSALHCAVRAIQLQPGEEIIVPAISFAATANCVLYERGIPVFCDIDKDTMNIDANLIEPLITPKTRAIIMVDYAGQPPDYHAIRKICQKHNLVLIEDAAHSIGHRVSVCPSKKEIGNFIGSYADLTTFSFHPVKNLTTGEGGMIMTNNDDYSRRMKRFRNHGINTEYQNRKLYEYDIIEPGFNYRLTDFQCALGISQLKRVCQWIDKRNLIATRYNEAFKPYEHLFQPLKNKFSCAYHLFVIVLNLENLSVNRDIIFKELKDNDIGVNVHYKPIYLLSYYQNNPDIKTDLGLCPNAEWIYQRIITIPLFPTMTEEQIERVINTVIKVINDKVKIKIDSSL